MSIQFDKPISDEQQDFVRKMFGDRVAAMDSKTVLLGKTQFLQSEMKKLANETRQVVTLEVNGEGDIKTLSDGSRYKVTERGWKRID